MPLQSKEARHIAAALRQTADNGGDTAQMAEAIVSMWQEVNTALSPVVGQQGVAALYKRSIHLAGATHAWLAGAHQGAEPALDLAALRSVLLAQTSAAAAAAGGALLEAFCALLAGLVGSSFTDRLLRPVWDRFSIGPPEQDILS